MQSDDFMADNIIARSDVVGDLNGRDASVEKIVLDPFGTVGFSADLVDLEPLSVGLVELVAGDGSTRGQQPTIGMMMITGGHYLAIISRPPVEADGIARIRISDEGSWAGIGTAGESRVVCALVGILCADLADDAGVGGTAWSVPLEVSAVDRDASEGAVG